MVLNLITLNTFAFKPGLGCRKNTLPLLAIRRMIKTIRKMGSKIMNPVSEIMKSKRGFKYFE